MDHSKPNMSKEFKTNEYHKGEYKFTEEGNLKNSKKEGLWRTYIHFEIQLVEGGILKPGEERKITNSGRYGKSLFKDETFVKGKLDGPYSEYYWDIEGEWKRREGFYKNGEKNGEWINHGRHSGHDHYNYKNGKKDGPFKSYQQGWVTPKKHSTNILTREGSYKDGKLHGNYKSYNFENSHHKSYIISDLNYKNGQLHGYCKYYQLYPYYGVREREGEMKNGKTIGTWSYYNYNGTELKYEIEHISEKEYIHFNYSDRLILSSESHYKRKNKDDVVTLKRILYHPDGTLRSKTIWDEDGEFIDRKEY